MQLSDRYRSLQSALQGSQAVSGPLARAGKEFALHPASFDLARVAYTFDHQFEDTLPDEVYAPLEAAAQAWRLAWRSDPEPSLTFRWSPGLLRIEDRRRFEATRIYDFPAPLSEMYLAISNAPLSAGAIVERLRLEWPASDIAVAMDAWAEGGLVMEEEGLYLALALPHISGR